MQSLGRDVLDRSMVDDGRGQKNEDERGRREFHSGVQVQLLAKVLSGMASIRPLALLAAVSRVTIMSCRPSPRWQSTTKASDGAGCDVAQPAVKKTSASAKSFIGVDR
jgi:hypothetical protein